MKIKSIILAFALIISGTIASGQNTSFAVLGGVNFQNINGLDFSGDKLSNDMIIGFHAGVNAQIPIAKEFYFQPGILYSTKGAKNVTDITTTTYHLAYVEVPLNLTYKALLGNGSFMLGFGPYVGYGISGKVLYETSGLEVERKVVFQNTIEVTDPVLGGPYFRSLDFGGNIFTGYEMANGVFVQLNVQLGMININSEDNRFPADQSAIKNTGFGLSIGYRL